MVARVVAARVKRNAYFLAGMALGLALALLAAPLDEDPAPCAPEPLVGAPSDEYEPRREERPPAPPPPGQAPGARALQRPRYYSTELGMRAPLLAAVLSTEDALGSRVAALNVTLRRLPALRYFMAASALRGPAAGLPGVVGFTDSREMLRPFHALKYLADNHLDDYDFFFLVGDATFVNVPRLTELVAGLSVSRDVYMGAPADGDGHYCTLDGGILLSNSVLRAVHAELDWCVRNSYSPHHHENIGRCVLHAAHVSCQRRLQGQRYEAATGAEGRAAGAALARAATAHPALEPAHLHRLHAAAAALRLDAAAREVDALRGRLARLRRRHPAGARFASWPAGLRGDAGLPPPPPASRFDLLRWTRCNGTHALLPDDHRAVAPLSRVAAEALRLAVEAARAWALARWPDVEAVELVEAASRWEPAAALRYRLLLRLRAAAAPGAPRASHVVRQVEVARVLGAARLVAVPYVTESARVALLLPVPAAAADDARGFLRRYEAACLRRGANVALLVVLLGSGAADEEALRPVEAAALALGARHAGAQVDVLSAPFSAEPGASIAAAALAAARAQPRDALVLLAVPHMEFNDDFLNRVRMNTIAGAQWFLPAAFARHDASSLAAPEERPRHDTGRFSLRHRDVLSFYRRDYDAALAAWQSSGRAAAAPPAEVLAGGPLHCLRAPDPALLLAPRGAPCALLTPGPDEECLRQLRADGFRSLDLGAAHALAKMALQEEATA